MGRKTDYSEEIYNKTVEYLSVYEDLGHALPSISGLSLYLKRSRTLLHDWAADDDKKEFKDILDEILATQEQVALSKGLRNEYNANLVKLLLGKHGYHDKVDAELTGANRGPIESKVSITFEGVNADSD